MLLINPSQLRRLVPEADAVESVIVFPSGDFLLNSRIKSSRCMRAPNAMDFSSTYGFLPEFTHARSEMLRYSLVYLTARSIMIARATSSMPSERLLIFAMAEATTVTNTHVISRYSADRRASAFASMFSSIIGSSAICLISPPRYMRACVLGVIVVKRYPKSFRAWASSTSNWVTGSSSEIDV